MVRLESECYVEFYYTEEEFIIQGPPKNKTNVKKTRYTAEQLRSRKKKSIYKDEQRRS